VSYEEAFAAGEHDSFADRQRRLTRQVPPPDSPERRGYRDGYLPRSPDWASHGTVDDGVVWQLRPQVAVE
jgi:hypothetical protein